MPPAPAHIPVLLDEVLDLLALSEGGRVIDATINGGGHAAAILERLGPGGRLLGLERDPAIAARARERFAGDERVRIVHSSFRHLAGVARVEGFEGADAILFDLGLSSFHLDQGGRGFSFSRDEPLDLRFDPTDPDTQSAAEILATRDAADLTEIFRGYGEERYASRIARAVIAAREEKPVARSGELFELIARVLPGRDRQHAGRSAARIFQALRIAANDELGAVREALPRALDLLRPGGRLGVISFHSLEDRIVKQLFVEAARDEKVDLVTRRPVRPGEVELGENSRAASARLRVAERRREGVIDPSLVERVLRYWIGEDHSPGGCEERVRFWFERSDATDNYIRERFAALVEKAASGALEPWAATPRGRLALVILLDQFSRNLHRGTAGAFAADEKARRLCLDGLELGHAAALEPLERAVFGLPLLHAEDLEIQERGVAYYDHLLGEVMEDLQPVFAGFRDSARDHRDVIARFGRFPHRNAALGRQSTEDEIEFLRQPGPRF